MLKQNCDRSRLTIVMHLVDQMLASRSNKDLMPSSCNRQLNQSISHTRPKSNIMIEEFKRGGRLRKKPAVEDYGEAYVWRAEPIKSSLRPPTSPIRMN